MAHADPLIGKVLADRYEILARIGEGGMGVVYRARQVSLNRPVAVKVLGAHVAGDRIWVERFRNEARALAKLSSPHTVRVYEMGETVEGIFYIAMELLEGGRTLREELDRVGRLPPAMALAILEQACQSLGEAHSRGILHRDLKPDNLYLNQAPGTIHLRVLDFSVAKLEDSSLTGIGVALGTPTYMSPEHVRGGLGPCSDIYSLGVLLHEMLSGRPPFESRVPTDVVLAHVREAPPSLAGLGLPDTVVALTLRALAKDPRQRPASCAELAAACKAALVAPASVSGKSDAGARTLLAVAPAELATLRAHTPAPLQPTLLEARAPEVPVDPTLVLPSSVGIAAFARREVEAARQAALATAAPRRARPAGALFWSAWVLLGIGVGLATHLLI